MASGPARIESLARAKAAKLLKVVPPIGRMQYSGRLRSKSGRAELSPFSRPVIAVEWIQLIGFGLDPFVRPAAVVRSTA